MRKVKNNRPINAGDLVQNLLIGAPEYGKVGIVLERIHYDQQGEHPDAYSCRVLFEGVEKMYRARWLKVVSKKYYKGGNVNNIHYETKI